MLKLNHKKLEACKPAIIHVKDIYALTIIFPKEEQLGLTSQLKPACVSAASNIAEGSAGNSPAERKRFFEIAGSSVVEIDRQFEIIVALEIVKLENLEEINSQLNQIFAMLSSLIKSQIPS